MELLTGLVLVIVAVLVWYYSLSWGAVWGINWNFGTAAWEVLKGGVIWGVIMVGLLFLMLGISDLKE